MGISEDSSTPTVTFQKAVLSVTSPSFSPPADSLLVAIMNYCSYNQDLSSSVTMTVSDSDSHTWTSTDSIQYGGSLGDDYMGCWIAYTYLSSAPGSMTVKFKISGSTDVDMMLDVRVVDGAASNQSGAANNTSHGLSSSDEVTVDTTTVGSWVYLGTCAFATPATLSPENSNTTTINSETGTATGSGAYNRLLTGRQTNSTVTTGNISLGWIQSEDETYTATVGLEILPAATNVTVDLAVAEVNVAAISPVPTTGTTVELLTAKVNVAAYTPSVSASRITSGGSGSGGFIKLTYLSPNVETLAYSVSPILTTDAFGNELPIGYQGPVSAIQPGTSPTVTEIWHKATLSNATASGNGVNGFWYRYTSDNEVELEWDITLTATGVLFTLPAGYVPPVAQNIVSSWYGNGPASYSNTFSPSLTVNTSGQVSAQNFASLTSVSLCGRSKITLDAL